MAKARKKKKRRSTVKSRKKKSGGGVMMSLRSGFKNAAHSATGSGKKKPQTTTGKVLNWGLTVALFALVAYLLAKRFGYIE